MINGLFHFLDEESAMMVVAVSVYRKLDSVAVFRVGRKNLSNLRGPRAAVSCLNHELQVIFEWSAVDQQGSVGLLHLEVEPWYE
jgi:hypothetical protein